MNAIYKRELRSYFTSPIGYVFLGIFLAANGVIFSFTTLKQGASSNISNYFTYLIMSLVLLIPLLTMKVFSEERKSKTEQLLLTSPVSLTGIVAAKFLAAYTMFAAAIALSCLNFPILYLYGTPSTAIIVGSVISALLVGAACTAIGIFISSLTENQLIASLSTMALLLVLECISIFNSFINSSVIRTILNWFSILNRFSNFTYGIFDFSALIYYISVAVIFLFLTARVFEKRRWE